MKSTIGTLALALFLLGLPPSAEAQNLSKADRQKMLENILQADQNNDGSINRSEFSLLIDLNAADDLGRASRIKRMGVQDRVFQKLDGDRNGLLTQDEMKELASQREG